jgi:hypothetical protein
MEQNVALLAADVNEFLDCREGGLGRTAKNEIAIVVVSQRADNVIAWISTIENQDSSRPDGWQQIQGLLPLRYMNAQHCPGHWDASEHIIGG